MNQKSKKIDPTHLDLGQRTTDPLEEAHPTAALLQALKERREAGGSLLSAAATTAAATGAFAGYRGDLTTTEVHLGFGGRP